VSEIAMLYQKIDEQAQEIERLKSRRNPDVFVDVQEHCENLEREWKRCAGLALRRLHRIEEQSQKIERLRELLRGIVEAWGDEPEHMTIAQTESFLFKMAGVIRPARAALAAREPSEADPDAD